MKFINETELNGLGPWPLTRKSGMYVCSRYAKSYGKREEGNRCVRLEVICNEIDNKYCV